MNVLVTWPHLLLGAWLVDRWIHYLIGRSDRFVLFRCYTVAVSLIPSLNGCIWHVSRPGPKQSSCILTFVSSWDSFCDWSLWFPHYIYVDPCTALLYFYWQIYVLSLLWGSFTVTQYTWQSFLIVKWIRGLHWFFWLKCLKTNCLITVPMIQNDDTGNND